MKIRTILLAEDHTTNQRLLEAFLDRDGYAVDLVENGLEAVEAYRRYPPNLILMDLQMPVMDGIEATRRIRAMEKDGNRHIPIVSLSTGETVSLRREAEDAGVNAFLEKPVQTAELFRTIEKLLAAGEEAHTTQIGGK